MRSHAPLCVLPPCASPCLWAGRIRGLTLSPVSLCSLPASSCTHLDRPHGLSFRLSRSSRCGRPSFFFPAVSLLYPCPASIRLPATGLLCRTLPHLWQSGATNRHQVALGHHMPTGSGPPPLPCLPDLPLPVEHTHIAVPCHFASSPPADCPHKTKRKESRGFPSSCQRGGHRASQILS